MMKNTMGKTKYLRIIKIIYASISLYLFTIILFMPNYSFPQSSQNGEEIADRVFLYGDKKSYFHKEGYVDLSGNPFIRTETEEVTSDNMKYFKETKNVVCIGHVVIKDRLHSTIITGEKAKYNAGNRYTLIEGGVKITSPENQFEMTCETVSRDFVNMTILATKRVVLVREKDDSRVYAQEALYIIPEKKIILTGDAKVIYNKNIYSAKTMVYHSNDDLIFMKGNCQIINGKKHIYAEEIKYFSSELEERALLKGTTRFEESSADDSLLKGQVFRTSSADRMFYYTDTNQYLKLSLIGNAITEEKYIQKKPEKALYVKDYNKGDFLYGDTGKVDVSVYKRIGTGDKIQFIRKSDSDKVILLGNATITQPYQIGFADRIIYYGNSDLVKFIGNSSLYEFYSPDVLYEKNNPYYSTSSIRRKAVSEYLYYFKNSEKMYMKGSAVVVEQDREIYADMIEYYAGNKNTGYAYGNSRVVKKNQIAQSDKLEYLGQGQKVNLYDNARLKDEKGNTLADKVEYFVDKDTAVLSGNAIVFDKDQEAAADEIEYISKDQNKAILKGHPRFIKGNMIITSDTAEYTRLNDGNHKIVLKGNVQAIEDERVIVSDKMEYSSSKQSGKEEITFSGNASFNDGEVYGYGDKIKYVKTKADGKTANETMTIDGIESDNDKEITSKSETTDDISRKARLQQGNVFIRGMKIQYFKDRNPDGTMKEKAIMEGRPELLQAETKVEENSKKDSKKYAKADKITYEFDDVKEGEEDKNYGIATLEGDAYVKDESVTTKYKDENEEESEVETESKTAVAEKILYYNREEKKFKMIEDAKFYDDKQKIDVRSDYVYFNEETGYMEAKRNPENKKSGAPVLYQEEEKVVIQGELLKGWMKKGVAVAQGDVKMSQQDDEEGKNIWGQNAKLYNKDYLKDEYKKYKNKIKKFKKQLEQNAENKALIEKYNGKLTNKELLSKLNENPNNAATIKEIRKYNKKIDSIKKKREKVEVTGRVIVKQGKNVAEGNKVVIDTKTRRIEAADIYRGVLDTQPKKATTDEEEEETEEEGTEKEKTETTEKTEEKVQ